MSYDPSGTIFAQTTDKTVVNSAAETTLTAAGVGSLTLRANSLVPGKTIRIKAKGFYSETGNPTIRFKIKIGAVIVLDTTAESLNGSGTANNAEWTLNAEITCRTTGVGGTVAGQGEWVSSQNSATSTVSLGMTNTSPVTIDTTVAEAIDLTVQWGAADPGDTITCTNLTVEVLAIKT